MGRPNVGKSSLLNKLLGDERALVSYMPGTTRDPVDTELSFDGLPVVLVDTAGIRRRTAARDRLEQAVLAADRSGKTIVTGMNGVPSALRAVKDGKLAMTVELNPVLWGRLGVDVLASYLKGEKVEPRVFIKHVIIDQTNIDAKLPKT